MKIFLFVGLLMLCSSTVLSQELSREQKMQTIADLNTRIKILENELLVPDAVDIRQAEAMGLSAVRLFPQGKFDGRLFDNGGGAYYSFSLSSLGYKVPEVLYEQGHFRVGFAGADYGLMTDLGQANISGLDKSKPEVAFLAGYQPPKFEKEIRAEYQNYRVGRKINGLTYNSRLPAVEGHSYLLRAVSIEAADILVAFSVLNVANDGSIVIGWKKLLEFEKPIMLGLPDSELKATIQRITAEMGLAVEVDVKDNRVFVLRSNSTEEVNRLISFLGENNIRTRGFDYSKERLR